MRLPLSFLAAILLLLGACTVNKTTYTAMNPVVYYITIDDAPIFLSSQDTTSAANHLVANTAVTVVGHYAPDWYVIKWSGKPYYLRRKYTGTSRTSAYRYISPTPRTRGGGSSGSSHYIQTGPRGGKYYINKNGNKTYIKH
jgi:hypothetical protein